MNYQPNPHLQHRAIIQITWKPETPIHVGAGQDGIRKRIVMVTVNGRKQPVIPSETVKGCLRHLATRIAKSMKYSNPVVQTAVKTHQKDLHKVEQASTIHKQAKEWLKQVYTHRQIEELTPADQVNLYLSYHCPVCRLFGGRGIASKLLIHDTIPTGEWTLKTYTSTAISRKTRTADHRKLYTIEYIPPRRVEYQTKIIADNVLPGQPDAKLLANILNYLLEKGLQVGGLKTRGYGHLTVVQEKSNVKILKINPNPQSLEEQVENIKALLQKPENILETTIQNYIETLLK